MTVIDAHVHDSKALPELVNSVIELDKKKQLANFLLMDLMIVMIFLYS